MPRRTTTDIPLRAAENVIMAAGFADQIGLPLNRFVTVAWEWAQCVGRIQDHQARFLERMSKWLKYRGVVPAFVWVIENGPTKGLHSHIAVHVPSEHLAGFKRKARTWVDGDVDKNTINIQRTRYGNGESRLNGIKGRLRYLLKGGDGDVAALLRIDQKHQGAVTGKRCGTSQNLGPAERHRHGERDKAA